jgi:DNA-binding NtrC family response regulator
VLIISTTANCEIAKSAMSHWALDPICCSSLREARALLLDAGASVIFCDAQLQDGTYQDLLRTLDKTTTNHFVVITSAPDDEKYEEAMQLGAFDVIVSPCRRSDVQWIVIRAMQEDRREGEKPTPTPEDLSSGAEK